MNCIQLVEDGLAERTIKMSLNQQQLALIDRTVAQGIAADRTALIKMAITDQRKKTA